jgi:hypothetical protein
MSTRDTHAVVAPFSTLSKRFDVKTMQLRVPLSSPSSTAGGGDGVVVGADDQIDVSDVNDDASAAADDDAMFAACADTLSSS